MAIEDGARSDDPLRLIFVLEQLTAGGVETYYLTKTRWFVERGHQVTVVAAGGELENEFKATGASCLILPSLTQRDSHPDQSQLQADLSQFVNLVAATQPRAIYTSPIRPFLFGLVADRQIGVNHALQIFSPIHLPPIEHRDDVAQLGALGRLFHVVPSQARLVAEGFQIPVDSFKVMPNPVDRKRFHPIDGANERLQLGISPDDFVILSNSRLDEDKAVYVSLLIGDFAHIERANRRALLVIVGDGSRRAALEDYARRLGIERIRFLGRRLDVPTVLSVADVFVGMGYSALEAAACGKPVVYTRMNFEAKASNCANGYLSADGIDTFGYPIIGEKPTSFQALIFNLMFDPQLRARVAMGGQRLIAERYDAERHMREWEAFYRSLPTRTR